MKRFEFKLQSLLNIREAREKEVKNELAKIMQVQNRERAIQQKLKDGIEQQKEKFRERFISGKSSPHESIMFERFVDTALRAIEGAEIKIQNMEPEVQKVREKLIEVSKEKKVVEKLKERQFDEYNYEMNRETAKESDDMNQKIYYRNKAMTRQENING